MKNRMFPIKNFFLITMPLFIILLNILVFVKCGGGFRQDSENAQEFSNPIFNNREFILDTAFDTSYTLQ